MSYSSTLHIAIDSTGAEGSLKRLENRLELTDRAGDGAASSVSNVGLEADRMRNMVMRASGVLTGSAAAFGLMARQSSDAAREIKNLSRLAGADVVTFQKMTMASRAFGIEQEQLAQIMLDTQDRIGDFLQTGQGEFADFFEQIAGKSDLTAQALARMAGPEALQAIYNALEDANLSASETVFYMESLASDATRLIPLLQDNGAGFREVANEAERLGVALSEVEIDQLAALRGEFADLETIISSSTSQIIAEYSGEITSTVDALGDSVSLLADNFDTVQDVAALAAGVFAGRLAGSLGTVTVAKLAATRQAILYQGALARMAGISTTAAISQTALGTASRGAAGALALVGGPLGAAVIAASAIYHFREELGLTQQAIGYTEEELASLRQEMADMDGVQITQTLSQVEDSLFQVGLKAAAAREELAQLRSESAGSGFLGFEGGRVGEEIRGMQAVAEYTEKMTELEQKRAVMQEELTSRTEEGTVAMDDMTVTAARLTGETESLGKATGETAEKTYTVADSYEALLDRITPNRTAARQYAQDLGTLNLALASGRMTAQQYMQAMGMLQESFQAAQRETDNLATASEDASQRIANSFLSWETVADNTLRRIDDSGQSLWLGLIDGSESALDTVKRGFQQSLAEIAHMLTTQRLTFHVAGMMGLDTTGMPGGGGGLNLSSLGSLYSSATNLPYVGDAISGVGSALGFGSSAAAGGTAVSGGFMSAAATQSASSLYGLAATGGAAPVSLMSSITSGISAAMPWLAGGMLVDNVLGLGIVDGIVGGISDIFGGGKSDPRLNISTRGDAGQFSHESVRSGAFGAVGFSEGTKRSNDLFGSVEAEREWLASVAALDNLTAAAARTPEQLDAMTSAVQNMVLTSGDAQGAIDQLAGRTAAATRVIDAELTQTLLDAGASAEQIAQRFATARNAVDLITAASERLNLQYDANADGALRYADSLVQAFGSVENIAAIQDAYYNAAFSDQERLQHQFDDVRGALNGLTDEAPRTVAELRALVEAQQLNGGASQQLAYDLMALAPALKETSAAVRQAIEQQYQDVLGRAPDTSGMDYWFDQVASGAITLEDALWNIANSAEAASVAAIGGADAVRERTQLELQLLRILGDTHALRDYELSQLAESNRPLQQRIWAIEDERAAMREAERAQQERIRALEQEARTMMSAGQNIRQFVESLQNTGGAGVSPETAYRNAEESFLAAISTIYTSDDSALVQDTINGITGIAQQYLSAAEAYGASGNIYQQAQALVEGSLDDLAGRLGSDELTDIDPQLEKLIQGMDLLNESIAKMASDLNNNFDMLDTSLDGVIDFEEFKDAFGDILSNDQLDTIFNSLDANMDGVLSATEAAAANTGLAGPLAKQVPLAQTFAEFFGGSGSQNYMVRQIGALAEIEKAIRNLEFSSGGGSDIDTSPSQPTGKTLTRSQVTSLVDASDNFSFLKQTMRGDSSQRAFSRSLAGDFNSGSLAPSVARNNVDKLISAVGFDEANYLRLNPDIAEAIGRGEIYSGFQHFLLHGIDEGRQFYNGGYTGPGGKYEPAGIVHRGEVVWSQDDISAWGGVGVVESLRRGPMELPMPDLPLPQFPALGQSDVTQVLQDMRREITELRKQNAALLGESNSHLAAANTQRGAAATQQIAATKEGNKMLKKMQDDSRLEAAKR